MRVRAIYVRTDANPFLPDWQDYLRQFRQIETEELPDDADMPSLEHYARGEVPRINEELAPLTFRFVRIEKIS